ncbi:creatininase family protein [Agrobacterium radiobacter]|uniref:creatininase family protein n=1 Tax=Agrobacterium radiobacter TaxID=362 RepID=UPI003CE53ED0
MKRPAVILIPLASQEEQGPHAPMGDFMLTERLAEMSARAGDGLTAPVLPFGHAEFFRAIAGGIQLRAATFTAVIEDILTSFLDHGHEQLLIFNGHTTNAPLIDQACRSCAVRKAFDDTGTEHLAEPAGKRVEDALRR